MHWLKVAENRFGSPLMDNEPCMEAFSESVGVRVGEGVSGFDH